MTPKQAAVVAKRKEAQMYYLMAGGAVAAVAAGAFWLLGALDQSAGEQARKERLARNRGESI